MRTISICVSDPDVGDSDVNKFAAEVNYTFNEGDATNFLYHISRLMLAMGYEVPVIVNAFVDFAEQQCVVDSHTDKLEITPDPGDSSAVHADA